MLYKKHTLIFLLLVLLPFYQSCQTKTAEAKSGVEKMPREIESNSISIANTVKLHPDFGSHWYQGKAELTNYDLEQSRYGEIHKGHAVLIFVTEDFLRDKQVKYEYGDVGNDKVEKVMKLNFTRKFNTGIYPYSLMTSIFSPLKADKPLKISSTMQEWCGQTFMQINQRQKEFEGIHHSYFQSESDQNYSISKDAIFEDDLWTMVRKNPKQLPTGKLEVVPAMQFLRMRHKACEPINATASLSEDNTTGESTYTVAYSGLGRTLKIIFKSDFPYNIQSWEEQDGRLTTKATLKKQIMLDYWSRNGVSDGKYREMLGLE